MSVTDPDLTAAINNVLNRRMKDLEDGNLTKKDVRREVETDLGLPKKSLDVKKKFIGRCINDFIASHSGEGDEEEEEVEEPPRKKRKTEKKKTTKKTKKTEEPAGEEKKVVKCKITVAEGMEAPKKGIKDAQRNIMTTQEFTDAASSFQANIFDNIVEAFPRTFTSGNKGWWGGGKVWIPVGDKKLWAQLGINLTIIGSKEWADEDASEEEEEE